MAEPTDDQIDAALVRGEAARLAEPRAASARYDRQLDRVIVDLTNGCTFAFPPRLAQGLETATEDNWHRSRYLERDPACTGRRSTPTAPSQACSPACSGRPPTWLDVPDG